MSGSQSDILLDLYASPNTVFTMPYLRLCYPGVSPTALLLRINRFVKAGRLLNIRRGIYAKPNYNALELACCLYTPSYISLEYVLQKAGVIFQYDSAITMVSYLGRVLEVDTHILNYRRIKGEIMVDMRGIEQHGNITIATPERAFLDTLYLNSNYYFDNLHILNRDLVMDLLPIYHCKRLEKRAIKLLKDGYK